MRVLPLILSAALCALTQGAAANGFTTLKGHGGPVMGLAANTVGDIASASFDNSVGFWRKERPLWLEGHDAAVVDVVFAGDTEIISGGDDFSVRLWRDGESELLGRHRGKVTDLEVSPDRSRVASASWDGTVGIWSLRGEAHFRFDQHDAGFSDVAFSSDGKRLFAATSAGEIVIYDLATRDRPRVLVRNGFGINEMILGPGDAWLAYGAVDGVTRVVDPLTGDQLSDFTLDRRPILAMAFDPVNQQIAVGDGHGYIMIIDTGRWIIVRDFRAMREGPVWALAFDPEGETIYAGGLDNVIFRWPVALLDAFAPAENVERSFLRDADEMSNGERQFMRKCSICHSLERDGGRKAGPTLHGVFGRPAGSLPGYRYSQTLLTSQIVWSENTIDALFDEGPDHYIPNSKMPMQRITAAQDRDDLIAYLKRETSAEGE
ncbi:c-type cytochrome [Marimonas sp. MJW-29]|uniref:C-type cytochrome n=1 Tax=Sulfitobacter sediminis TaxID=3234186 RepID=A0ABV3RLI2_9RHOB